jgi:hypothetical protein
MCTMAAAVDCGTVGIPKATGAREPHVVALRALDQAMSGALCRGLIFPVARWRRQGFAVREPGTAAWSVDNARVPRAVARPRGNQRQQLLRLRLIAVAVDK